MAAKLPDSPGEENEDANDGLFAEINITPLTDVFLVMVVIFMVTALAEVEQTRKEQKQTQQEQQQSDAEKRSGLRVNLPQGKAQEIDTSKASLVLTVPMQGDVDIGGKSMPDVQIDAVFQAAFQRDHNTQVIL
jgi:biopolymer transport protein ExbD